MEEVFELKKIIELHLTNNSAHEFRSKDGKYFVIAIVTKEIGTNKIFVTIVNTNIPELKGKEITLDNNHDSLVVKVGIDTIEIVFLDD